MTQLSLSTGAIVFDAIAAVLPEGRPVPLPHGFPQTGPVWRCRGLRVSLQDVSHWVLEEAPEKPSRLLPEHLREHGKC